MRRYWGTFALLALAALLGLYFVFIETPRERARVEQQEREGRVLSLSEDEVTKLEIETPSDRLVLERAHGGAWRVSAPVSAEADEGTVRRLLSQLTSLSVVRKIDDVGDSAALGLDRPAVRVIAYRSEGRAEVAFGDENPLGSGVYVQRDDRQVFLTATTAKSTFEVSRDDVRRKEFIDFKPEAVSEIAITHRGRSVRLNREGVEWRMAEPARTADPDTVSSLLSRLRALRATGFADTVEQRDALRLAGKPRTDIAMTAGPDVVHVAILQAADGSLYARASGDTLYRLNESVVSALPLDASALRDLRVVRATFDDVRAVEVERGQERYRVTRNEGGWDLDGRRLAEEGARQVEAMIRSLTGLRGESVAAETPTALPPNTFASPAARIALRGPDDRPLSVVTISDVSGARRYAFSESSGPVFSIAPTTADQVPAKSALETHLAPAS
jgi:hypothetical protein